MILRTFLIVLLLSIHGWSYASDAQSVAAHLGQVVIEIPTGFGEMHRTFPNKQSELDVYVSSKDLAPTLIELERIVIPWATSNPSEENRYGAASDFLVGFLQTFREEGVTDWSRSSVEPVRLGGYLAARAKWSGTFHGIHSTGFMYIVVFGKESYCFHAFGSADATNGLLKSSIQAIEKLRVAPFSLEGEGLQ